jgi:hypothetical protein
MESPTPLTAVRCGASAANTPVAFTDAQYEALARLCGRYEQSGDILSERELARLRFLQWLYRSGRLVP